MYTCISFLEEKHSQLSLNLKQQPYFATCNPQKIIILTPFQIDIPDISVPVTSLSKYSFIFQILVLYKKYHIDSGWTIRRVLD